MYRVQGRSLLRFDLDGTPEDTARTVSSLTWIAKRTSAATTSLKLAFRMLESCPEANSLVAALSGVAQLSNLRCLTYLPLPLESGRTDPVLVSLLDWLLEQVANIEAMRTCIRTRHLPASHITFHQMRHLVMTSQGFQASFLVAQQLPALETLLIAGECYNGLEVLDMSGCTLLRRLALSDNVAETLIWEMASSGPCPLALEMHEPLEDLEEACANAFYNQAALAEQLVIRQFAIDGNVYDFFSSFPLMKALTLEWPSYDPTWHDDLDFYEKPDYLVSCMPNDGQPLLNLETIIITASSMKGTFPGSSHLPNLRELVIQAVYDLDVQFQDPVGTISGLASLHVSGRPLISPGVDTFQHMTASGALERRGLVLGAATARQPGADSSCIYLRPVGAQELSMEELSANIEQLVQCRCGACFDCLQKAGCIDG